MLWAGCANMTRRLGMANRMAEKTKDRMQPERERWAGLESTLKVVLKVVLPLTVPIGLALLGTIILVPSNCCNEGGGVNWVCYIFGVDKKDDAIRMLGWGLGGAIAICALVIANRRAKGTMAAAEAQANAVKATEAGHRQQRFSDGVNHLGHDKESLRQGGAHALFHLALDDQKRRASIADILCAHVRATTGDNQYQTSHKDKPSTEIQSLLNLLFTTKNQSAKTMDTFWKGLTPDLSGGYFHGAELPSARFQRARLEGAQFQGARLEDAQFQGARLEDAQFQGAWLTGAQFQLAKIDNANFHGALLSGAGFHGACITDAQFQGAWLHGAQFQGAEINDGTNFAGAYSARARQRDPRFEVRIMGGIGEDVDFSEVDFMGQMGSIDDMVAQLEKAGVMKDKILMLKKKLEPYKESASLLKYLQTLEKMPADCKGAYSKADAEQWIQEYQQPWAQCHRLRQPSTKIRIPAIASPVPQRRSQSHRDEPSPRAFPRRLTIWTATRNLCGRRCSCVFLLSWPSRRHAGNRRRWANDQAMSPCW